MKKRENTGKIIGKVFGEARALGVTALAAAVMLSDAETLEIRRRKAVPAQNRRKMLKTAKCSGKYPNKRYYRDAADFRAGGGL